MQRRECFWSTQKPRNSLRKSRMRLNMDIQENEIWIFETAHASCPAAGKLLLARLSTRNNIDLSSNGTRPQPITPEANVSINYLKRRWGALQSRQQSHLRGNASATSN